MKKLFALLALFVMLGANISLVDAKGTKGKKCSSKGMTKAERKAKKAAEKVVAK